MARSTPSKAASQSRQDSIERLWRGASDSTSPHLPQPNAHADVDSLVELLPVMFWQLPVPGVYVVVFALVELVVEVVVLV